MHWWPRWKVNWGDMDTGVSDLCLVVPNCHAVIHMLAEKHNMIAEVQVYCRN